ncbi:MAG: 30S ribosomal protein S6 [Cyclobacteriaceae bacterium]
MLQNYETVFILTPVLSETQMKDAVDKFRSVLKDNGAEIVNDENWGLKKLAYPILGKSTGFYHLFEFKSEPGLIATLETEYRRDEAILRFLTVKLDKHAVAYNEKRKRGDFNKKEKEEAAA